MKSRAGGVGRRSDNLKLVLGCVGIPVLFALLMLVVVLLATGCGRAEAQTGTFPPALGFTDCGPRGAAFSLNAVVQYDPRDHSTAQRRWGMCDGVEIPDPDFPDDHTRAICQHFTLNQQNDRRCILAENERTPIRDYLRWQWSGRCDGVGAPEPSVQLMEDWGKVVGAFRKAQRDYNAPVSRGGCGDELVQPSPTVVPTPAVTPTVAPAPSLPPPEPLPSPSPPTTCTVCDQYDELPAKPLGCQAVERLAEKRPGALLTWGVDRAANVAECAAWLGAVRGVVYRRRP